VVCAAEKASHAALTLMVPAQAVTTPQLATVMAIPLR